MTEDLIINVRERGTSACIEPNYRIEVVDGMRATIVLERIANALERIAGVKSVACLSSEESVSEEYQELERDWMKKNERKARNR